MKGTADPGRQPKVSVLLTTYNHEPFIENSFNSVLRQRVAFPFEIIVADDDSTDGTRQIVLEYALEHPDRIRLLLPPGNIGMNPIFRQALAAARGEYLAFLDGDDYWTSPDKLRTQVELLDEHPDWVSCFHDVVVFYEDASNPPRRFTPGFGRQVFGREDAIRICFAPKLSVLLRRSALEAVPEWVFDHTWSDWLMHVFTAERGGIGYVDQLLGVYRVHPGRTFSSQDRSLQLEEDLRVYARLAVELPDCAELIRRCIVHRRYQLAVEETSLPYDAPIVVIDERGDMPLYFNGRQARYFPGPLPVSEDLGAVESFGLLLAELAGLPPAAPHYRPRAPAESRGHGLAYVVVPSTATALLDKHPELRRFFALEADEVHRDEWCAIHELRLPPTSEPTARRRPARSLEVASVSVAEPLAKELQGASIEGPSRGEFVEGSADVVGWVVARDAPVAEVELVLEEDRLVAGPVAIARPDLERQFGDGSVPRAGFSLPLALDDHTELPARVEARAILDGGVRIPFAAIEIWPFQVPPPPGPRWRQQAGGPRTAAPGPR